MTTGIVIPFGKYAGHDVAEIAQRDPQYLQWLGRQDWARERFPHLLNITINNFGAAAEETPEHSALQLRFLDEAFQRAFVLATGHEPTAFDGTGGLMFEGDIIADVHLCSLLGKRHDAAWMIEVKPSLGDDFPAVLRQVCQQRSRFDVRWNRGERGREHWVVVFGRYAGTAPLDQVRAFFATQDFTLVSVDAIEAELGEQLGV